VGWEKNQAKLEGAKRKTGGGVVTFSGVRGYRILEKYTFFLYFSLDESRKRL